MTWYHLLWGDRCVRNPFIADNVEFGNDTIQSQLETGHLIRDWHERVVLRTIDPRNDGNLDDALMNNEALLVFSERFQKAIKSEGIDGIQFLPVRVFRPDGSLVPGYAIANIVNLVSALDLEHSVYSRYEQDFPMPELRGQINLTKAALIRERLIGYDIFRLQEAPGYVFVSEKFRKLVLKNKLTGVGFSQVPVFGEVVEPETIAPVGCLPPSGGDMDALAAIVARASSAHLAWHEVVDWLLARGLDLNKDLGEVDVMGETKKVRAQLLETFKSEPVPKDVEFLYFGLFDISADPEGNPGLGFYVSGGRDFTPEDPDSLCDLPYFPDRRIIHCEALDRIRAWAMRERSKKEFIDYAVVFGLAAILSRFGTPQPGRKLEIVVGFDEGDYAVVG